MKKNWLPSELENELKKSTIGQDDYLHDLSTCIWLHDLRRRHYKETGRMLTKPKYNMLIIGKSGMGKTSALQEAAKLLDFSLIIEDASELTGSGWKGRQVTEIVRDVIESNRDENGEVCQEDAEFSIVVLDEIDKVFQQGSVDTSFLPVNNLLKFIEGAYITHPDGNHRYSMNTDNLLFICIGAFDGLEEIIAKRISPKSIGFGNVESPKEKSEADLWKHVTARDLAAYGISEQFLGRIPMISVMNTLKVGDYEDILLKSSNSPVQQLNELLSECLGVQLTMTPKAAAQLADQVKKTQMGARALQSELLSIVQETLYEIGGDRTHHAYQIDYQSDGFCITAFEGERTKADESSCVSFEMSDDELSKFGQVSMDIRYENYDSVIVFTETAFGILGTRKALNELQMECNASYDYLTIQQAKSLVSAAVVQTLIHTKQCRSERTMLELLNTLKEMDGKITKSIHPLAKIENLFLLRLEYCSPKQIETLKKIAWFVLVSYAEVCYENFCEAEADELLWE